MINTTCRMGLRKPTVSSVRASPRVNISTPRPVIVRFRESASDFAPETKGLAVDALIKKDHDKVRELFSEYEKLAVADKQMMAYNIIRELSIHSSREEDTVYPVMLKEFGQKEAQHMLDEHHALKKLLEKLGSMDVTKDEAKFDEQVRACKAEFEQHAKEEENIELPKLMKSSTVDGMDLGKHFQQAIEQAVTRPHPGAPDKFPINVVAKKLQSPIDKVGDAIRFNNQEPTDTIPKA